MQPRFIGLAGPSGAGKTTIVELLTHTHPDGLTHVRMDGYFKDIAEFPLLGLHINREAPENLYWDELYDALCELRRGQPAHVRTYDRAADTPAGTVYITPSSTVFVEGYLLFFDARIRELFDVRLFLDVAIEEQYRRKKQRWPAMSDDYFYDVVVPMFEQHGRAGMNHAHHVLDGNQSPEQIIQNFQALNLDAPHCEVMAPVVA